MKSRMKRMSQRRGRDTSSGSTASVAIVISGISVSTFVRSIWVGNSGRYGKNSEAPAIENMLPKFALVAMNAYLSVFAKVSRPLRTPCASTSSPGASNTIWAASFATSTAVSTEMPTSAAWSADASLMPSPR